MNQSVDEVAGQRDGTIGTLCPYRFENVFKRFEAVSGVLAQGFKRIAYLLQIKSKITLSSASLCVR